MLNLETQIEELEKMRVIWILVFLTGFVFWDGLRIIEYYLLENGVGIFIRVIGLLGWFTWTLGLIQIFRLGFKVKKIKKASQILNDELVELNRLKSWRIALITVILTQVVVMALHMLSIDISGILSAEISILVAVAATLSAFVYYEKSFASG